MIWKTWNRTTVQIFTVFPLKICQVTFKTELKWIVKKHFHFQGNSLFFAEISKIWAVKVRSNWRTIDGKTRLYQTGSVVYYPKRFLRHIWTTAEWFLFAEQNGGPQRLSRPAVQSDYFPFDLQIYTVKQTTVSRPNDLCFAYPDFRALATS